MEGSEFMNKILEKISESTKFVSNNSKYVKINYEVIDRIIEENDWDVVKYWMESNPFGLLDMELRDIINFTNTPSHNDAYIIFGISDQDGSVIGIDKNDPNRKNKQQLQDYLRNIPFAQNYYPKTNVETLEVNEKEIDILTIYNTYDVPLFLARDVARVDNNNKQKKKGKPLRRGLIYSIIGDSNTPVDQSTTDEQMERLWQKKIQTGCKHI